MRTAVRILLLRHAHAAWAQPGSSDFERPLDDRGVEDAGLIAGAMAANGLMPDIILCSAANRCVQTCEIIAAALPSDTDIKYLEALYNNDHEYYVRQLGQQDVASILLIGHNPMMEDTARLLTKTAEPAPAHRLQKGYPTAGLAIIDIMSPEAETPGRGHLADFLTPKRLKKSRTPNIAD